MEESIFRKKSLERVNSPDSLNDYLKVTNPGTWMILISLIALLTGSIIWGYYGRLETKIKLQAICDNGNVTCSIDSKQISSISNGMEVRVDGIVGKVSSVNKTADPGVYVLDIDIDLTEGVYAAEIVVESISPLSLVFN